MKRNQHVFALALGVFALVFSSWYGPPLIRAQSIIPNGSLSGSGSSSSSSGGASAAYALNDFKVTATSTVATINSAAGTATPVIGRIGSMAYRFTSSGTITITAGTASGNTYWYLSSSGVVEMCHNALSLTFVAGGTTAPTISGVACTTFPTNSLPLWIIPVSSGTWPTVDETMDYRSFISKDRNMSVSGCLALTETLSSWLIDATGCTGANPVGSGSELQYRSSGTAFGAVTNSSVSGANVTIAGSVTASTNGRLQMTQTGGATGLINFIDGFANTTPFAMMSDGTARLYVGAVSSESITFRPETNGGFQHINPVAVASLPACDATRLLNRRAVNNATVATPGSTAAGGGTFTIAVQCIFNSSGSAFSWIID